MYSQGVRVGAFLVVSGMIGSDVATGQLAGMTIQGQTKRAVRNCLAIVEAGGGVLADIGRSLVRARGSWADFAGMNEEYAKVFTNKPSTRAVAKLGVELPSVLVSITLTAYRDR